MVRATEPEVLIIFGAYPAGLTTAIITAMLPGGNADLNGYVKKYYKTNLSTTDADAIHIENKVVANKGLWSLWAQAGGPTSRLPEPAIFSQDVKDLIEAIISDTTTDHATTLDAIDTSD